MNNVTLIQRINCQYRIDFYRKLNQKLKELGIKLTVIVGEDKIKKNMDFLDSFIIKKNRYFHIFGKEFIYLPCLKLLKNSDLTILELRNTFLLNYVLMLKRCFCQSKKISFSGHALNMQTNKNSLGNILKRLYFKNTDWWFPYTDKMADILVRAGFPAEKITVFYNTTDVENLITWKDSLTIEDTKALRERLKINGSSVAIFCGRMYKEKRIDFLLESCLRIKNNIPDFYMIFIGSGEDSYKVTAAAGKYDWIKYVGPAYDKEKVAYFKLADIFLSPGLVGLSITESFALEVPMITTSYLYHSPEIEYLKNGVNGVMTTDDLNCFSQEAIKLLKNREYLNILKKGCREDSQIYTMENMVNKHVLGIKACLEKI